MARMMRIKEAVKQVRRPDGTPVPEAAFFGWIYKGVRGRKLPSVLFGRIRYIDEDELNSFLKHVHGL